MRLITSSPSPFGRKVKITLDLLGLKEEVDILSCDLSNPKDPIFALNPLGKIPALILKDETVLFDSRIICEYLDTLSEEITVIPQDQTRWSALRLQAIADGIVDAQILCVYEERYRTKNERSPDWVAFQTDKIERALKKLESEIDDTLRAPLTVGDISLACALGYLDLRASGKWRQTCPSLENWLTQFSRKVPAYEATSSTV